MEMFNIFEILVCVFIRVCTELKMSMSFDKHTIRRYMISGDLKNNISPTVNKTVKFIDTHIVNIC